MTHGIFLANTMLKTIMNNILEHLGPSELEVTMDRQQQHKSSVPSAADNLWQSFRTGAKLKKQMSQLA